MKLNILNVIVQNTFSLSFQQITNQSLTKCVPVETVPARIKTLIKQ